MIILSEVRNKDTNKKHVMYKNEIKKKNWQIEREKNGERMSVQKSAIA